jgi:amino acid adenylation domain-containing protein/non-ribosomal peptide synthase protein (TIGR01720 family)
MVIGLLGILKAGGAYLPLDPSYPEARLLYMIEDAGIHILLTAGAYRAKFSGKSIRLIALDTEWDDISRESVTAPPCDVHPDNLAYVIYTSGSTGKPKGTLCHHRGLSNLALTQSAVLDAGEDSRVLQFASLNFDMSVSDLLLAWYGGGVLCLIDRETQTTPQLLIQKIREWHVTLSLLPPSLLAVLPEEPLPDLRTVMVGGERCTADLVNRWGEGRSFFNGYGPTEAAVCTSMHKCVPGHATAPPIGTPLKNVEVYILDRWLQPVPAGVPGELYIGGIGLARGYLGRPELTAEKFVPHPFADRPGARLYRTGDEVRFLSDGTIEYLSRIDDQVKIHGYRIELGEIENTLRRHGALRDAVVTMREDQPGDRRLVAYVVAETEPAPPIQELRDFLAAQLPPYMIPATWVVLDQMPLMPNGKVDRKALPRPEMTREILGSHYVPPQTPQEQVLATIWQDVLGIPQVGVHDNFFALGGDSILSIQVIARANQAGLRLAVRQMFQYPTIMELARHSGSSAAATAEQDRVIGPLPLTPIQQWFFEHDFADPHHWNQSVLFWVHQPMDTDLMRKVLWHLLEHHDALRLRFAPGDDGWSQVSMDVEDDVPFAVIDLAHAPPEERAALIEHHCTDLQATLNFTRGPLMRMALLRMGDGEPDRLFTTIHHLAVDAVSWRTLFEDFETAYGQLSLGQPVLLPPKTTSYRQWANRIREHTAGPWAQEHAARWEEILQYPPAPLPVDGTTGRSTVASTDVITVGVDEETTHALLHKVHDAYGTEINDVLLTALALAVQRWTGFSSLQVDLESHGRVDFAPDLDVSRTVGWFTAVYPVRLDAKSTRGPGGALKAVKEQLRAIPQQGFTYQLLRYLSPDPEVRRRLASLPSSQISFNYLGQVRDSGAGSGQFSPAEESTGPSRSLKSVSPHPLEINGGVNNGRLSFAWSYSRDVFRRATVEQVAGYFVESLQLLREHCLNPEAVGYTPSDFALAELDQKSLDVVMGKLNRRKENVRK